MSRSGSLFQVETLALLPSWECDIACNHCVFSSSPLRKGRLALNVVEEVVADLVDVAPPTRVTVSGGEPFLDPDYLYQVATLSHSHGLRFRVVTNGQFADTEEAARAALLPLIDVGLESVGLSWDGFHAPFKGADFARNLLRASRRLGISVRITVVVTAEHSFGAAMSQLGDEAFEVPTTQVRCLPVGRARGSVPTTSLLPVPSWDRGRACRRDFDTVALTHDGSVYPCCAVGGFTDGIRLGNAKNQRIRDILRLREINPRFAILSSRGPDHLLAFATPEELAVAEISEGDHDCVKCNRMFASPLGDRLLARATAELGPKVDSILRSVKFPSSQSTERS